MTSSDTSLTGSIPSQEAINIESDNLDTQETEDQVIARLASMPPLEYERIRVEQAKLLGCRPAVLDNLVKSARKEDIALTSQPFPDIEPFPTYVDPALLLSEVSDTIRRYIVVDVELADAAALWVAFTWFIGVVEVAPLAIINAPEKACGKTQMLTVMGQMSYRPLPASNASASALFRAVEKWRPTILIDEADTFFRDNSELQGMVNAGYLRDGYVLRSEAVGDSFEPRMFSVFSAKAIAGIALERHLPDATMSRGVIFNLRRKLPHESVSRLRHADRGVFNVIAEKLARFGMDYSQQVRLARPNLPEALSDRGQDNWEPLLAIAECAGPDWVKRATDAALKLSSNGEASVSTGNELLGDIKHIFDTKKHIDKISTADLIAALENVDEGPWATYNRGKPISPRQLARQLAAYDIKSKTVRMKSGTPKGYDAAQFADAFARYLNPPDVPPQGNTPQEAMADKEVDVADSEAVAETPSEKATPDPLAGIESCGVAENSGGGHDDDFANF